MDFISSGSHNQINELRENYYKRYRYPDDYKVQTMFISKFEKDITSQIDYQFINAFPKTMTTIPVSYGDAELLKVSVTFNYDRYIVNPRGSYITSPNLSEFDDIPRTFLDTRYSRYSQSLFNTSLDPSDLPSTQELVDRDNERYGTTFPQGSFSITNSATSAQREVEAQIHKDTALYGNTFPEGSFGIGSKSNYKSPHSRPERKQFSNTRSGAKAYEKALKNWKAQYGAR